MPSIWEDVTFTADFQTPREISEILWDFGDGSEPQSGEIVVHQFSQESSTVKPLVRMTVIFADDTGDPTVTYFDTELTIDGEPDAGACPPQTIEGNIFQQSMLITAFWRRDDIREAPHSIAQVLV